MSKAMLTMVSGALREAKVEAMSMLVVTGSLAWAEVPLKAEIWSQSSVLAARVVPLDADDDPEHSNSRSFAWQPTRSMSGLISRRCASLSLVTVASSMSIKPLPFAGVDSLVDPMLVCTALGLTTLSVAYSTRGETELGRIQIPCWWNVTVRRGRLRCSRSW